MTDQASSKRERVINIVLELRKRTTENGCTEAEALLAATKISKLMEEYQLSISDIHEIRDDTYIALKRQYGGGSPQRRSWHETNRTWSAISVFTETKYWRDRDNLVFFGSQTDCEIAFFLCDLIKSASELEWKNYKLTKITPTNRRGRTSFMAGFSLRISERLLVLKTKREEGLKQKEQSRALVVIKDKVLTEKFSDYRRQTGLSLRSLSISRSTHFDRETFGAGKTAGERVNITTGIKNQNTQNQKFNKILNLLVRRTFSS
ncbi:MAG: DUF2786 domain-containing protein [Hyphomicrobium sp.]